jgi:predicted nucleic acid-binding protein
LKLIVDTNILFKALIKSSKVRAILLTPNHQFYIPEYTLEEVENHLSLLTRKTGLSVEDITRALSILLTNITVVSSENVSARWDEADRIIGSIDKGDVPFVAASLSMTCDGIWSDDKDLKRQRKVKVWSTGEMIRLG